MRADSFNIAYSFSVLKTTLSVKRKFIIGKFYPYLSIGAPLGIYLKDDGNVASNQPGSKFQTSFGRSGFFSKEFKHEAVLFGASLETGIEIPHVLTSKGIFFSFIYEYLRTDNTVRGNSFGLKTGIYF
jgi:hypothetical protein